MKKLNKKGIRMIVIVLVVIAAIIGLNLLIFPHVKPLSVTGKYQISSTDYWLTEDKVDPYSKDGRKRQLQIRKWYPLECTEKKPVLIASHGSCGTIDNNVSLYRELASYGYIVLAVGHPGQAAGIKYENGKFSGPSNDFLKEMTSLNPEKNPEKAYELFTKWMEIRIEDLNLVMDDYLKSESQTKFLAFGHSLGGSAAYAMARVRKDVVGCIAFESPFMYDVKGVKDGEFIFDTSDYAIPVLNVYSDSSYAYLKTWKQYKNNELFLESGNPNYTNIYYEGVGHMGLCDLALFSPVLASVFSGKIQKKNVRVQLQEINKDCLNWLKENLFY